MTVVVACPWISSGKADARTIALSGNRARRHFHELTSAPILFSEPNQAQRFNEAALTRRAAGANR